MGTRTKAAALATGVLVGLAALSACGSGGGSDSMSGGSAGSSADRAVGGAVAEPGAAPDASNSLKGPGANRTVVKAESVIKTGEIYLTSKKLDEVRAEVDRLMAAMGGSVDAEQTFNDPKGHTEESTLTLRVPVGSFDAAQQALKKLGKVKHAEDSAKDVTTQVIDVDERVQTLQNSLDRLQKFQRQATDVNDLLRYENEITDRQAELQSLTAQQSYLRDQTQMSTITLHLTTPARFVPPPDALKDAGFWTGLKSGWHALVDVVVVALTVLGAMLPFLVAGVLVVVPLWLLVRLLVRRRRQPAPPAGPAGPAAPADAV